MANYNIKMNGQEKEDVKKIVTSDKAPPAAAGHKPRSRKLSGKKPRMYNLYLFFILWTRFIPFTAHTLINLHLAHVQLADSKNWSLCYIEIQKFISKIKIKNGAFANSWWGFLTYKLYLTCSFWDGSDITIYFMLSRTKLFVLLYNRKLRIWLQKIAVKMPACM